MNALSASLLAPWRATHAGARWLSLAFYLLGAAIAVAIAVFGHPEKAWLAVAVTYGVTLFLPWAFFFPGTALLAKDARLLRVPALGRCAAFALPLYALAMLALPAAVFAALGWPLAMPLLGWALAIMGGFAFALLPRYIAVFCGFLPTLGNALAPGWEHLTNGADHAPLAVAALAALASTVGWRWRAFVRGRISEQGWSSPMVVQLRYGSWGAWSQLRATGKSPELALLSTRAGADVRECGPAWPVRSLRVALGGWYTPRSWRAHLRQVLLVLLLLGVPATAVWLGHLHDDHGTLHRTAKGALEGAMFGFAAMVSPLVCLLSWAWLSRRWQRVNMELPLLALLPGLGSAVLRKRHLLRAALQRPLAAHALCFALALAACHWLPLLAPLLGLQLVAIPVGALTSVALVLDVLGGRPHSLWTVGPLLGAVFVLQNASLVIGALLGGRHAPAHGSAAILAALLGVWLLLALWAGRLAWSGWRALAVRPQPFAANPA